MTHAKTSSGAPIRIRTYVESDRQRLKDITVICFEAVSIDRRIEEAFGVVGDKDWKWRKARHIDADANANPDGIFVAESDGSVVGYITSRLDSATRIGWIPNLAVLPEYQGRGVGKSLMNVCFDYLRSRGMEGVRIETLEHNRAGARFYPQMGFREVARQIHYFKRFGDEPGS
jgi:GNAT superfamily N-acetyltransferase